MDKQKKENIIWHQTVITKENRQKLHGQKSCVLWFTGLSGSGKSTLANKVEERLHSLGISTYLLDGDNMRHGLNKDLGFREEDRKENIRRIGEVAKLFVDSGIIVLSAFISPYTEDRQKVRDLLEEEEFIEIYTKCSLEVCETRDPKGLYKKARKGEITDFTGISSPYEAPVSPEITVNTESVAIDNCTDQIIRYLLDKGYI
ncbi:adenylyl-sulfate kinase [Bacillus sp. WLY-B-L8]|uniref:adenylyl-sulfate kinase n=1 Tax=Bacillus multifaciens TaxID=3068506 RepID=UPI002740567C|nr:adenylyl-sulfate kinase [Bacillus sp. WLY-B-L8]MDP7977612.1 adenylyl-sulfate kinase [Bacillus sp. WLY-B-L8]